MARELIFVLPEDREAVSGGNLYNRMLLAALARQGVPARACGLREALDARDADEVLLVDSVLAESVPELVARAPGRTWMLVHLLPSMVPGQLGEAGLAAERERLAGIAGFVATSESARDALARVHPGKPTIVVPPALSHRPPEPAAPPARGRWPAVRALLVGNLIACKGLLELLAELDACCTDDVAVTLDVLGRVDLEPEYAAACRELVAARPRLARTARIHGPVPPADMPGWYERSDVLVSAARFESFGMAMHEARAFGLPLLATRAGNAPVWVTRPEHGKLCGSAAEVARTLVEWARDRDALRSRLAAAWQHRLIDPYGWDDAARRIGAVARSST